MNTEQLYNLLSFYKQTLNDSTLIEDSLKDEINKTILELDLLKVTEKNDTDTKEYLTELNFLLDRLY
ncbi:MAG: hypothetical protein ACK5MH_09170 [Bacteroidales bacterium]